MGGRCRGRLRHRKFGVTMAVVTVYDKQLLACKCDGRQGWAANILAALVNEFSSSKMGEMGLLLEFHNRAHLAFEVRPCSRLNVPELAEFPYIIAPHNRIKG